jgi:hypothetical protein
MITYCVTPDLKQEANPLVRNLHLGWRGLIIANVFSFIFYEVAALWFFRYKRNTIICKGFGQFISKLIYNQPAKLVWFLYKLPVNKQCWANFFAPLCYAVVFTFPIMRLLLALNGLVILCEIEIYVKFYYNLCNAFPVFVLSAILAFILVLFFYLFWFYKEYKINMQCTIRQGL